MDRFDSKVFLRDLALPETRARVRYSKGSKRRAAVLAQFLADLTESAQLPEAFYELLVLSRSDWHDRLSAPYGLPLTRVQHGKLRVIAAADYPERLVKSLDGLRLTAAQRGYQTPSTWPEFFDMLIGVAWGSTACLQLGLATRIFWVDTLTATALFARAYCYPRRRRKRCNQDQQNQYDPTPLQQQDDASKTASKIDAAKTTLGHLDSARQQRLQAWFAVCAAAGDRVQHKRAPHGLRPKLILQGHMGLAALDLTTDTSAWHVWQELIQNLPKSHGKADVTHVHIRLIDFIETHPQMTALSEFIHLDDRDDS
ncbi:MAG: hypothetical protein AAF708_17330 [Deinococcota bacterium]